MPSRRFRLVAPLLALLLPAASAVDAAGIGYVDMQRVLDESVIGKKIQAELRKDFEPKAAGLGKEEQEIRQLQQALARDSALMSKDQIGKKEAEIKKRIEAYQKEAGALQQDLLKMQQQKAPEVLGPARKAVDGIANRKKLSMVVERGMAGILFMEASADITDEVIKTLDASAK